MKCNKKRNIRILTLGLAAMLVCTSLTGCLKRKKTAYQTYMHNVLDVNYKGEFDGYIKDNDGDDETAAGMYNDSITYLAGQLINHYSLNNTESDEVENIFEDAAKVIYSNAKYEVSQAYKGGNGYCVDVTVYPMDILNQAFDDIYAYTDDYNKRIDAGEFNNTDKEEYEKQFAQGIADILEEKSADMEYLSPVVVTVKIVDDGDYYSVDTSDLSQVDATMLAIEGAPVSDN